MAATQLNSFERVFSKKDLFRGKSLSALAWGVLASFALFLLLVDLWLVANVLETRGRVSPSPAEQQEFREFFPDGSQLEDGGLRPAVWLLRAVPVFGRIVQEFYAQVPWFRENTRCLALLVLGGFVIACLRGLSLSRAEAASNGAGLDAATRLRQTLHEKTLRLGPGNLTDPEGTQVIALFTDGVDQVRDGIRSWVYHLGRYPSQLLFLSVLLLFSALALNWRFAVLFFLASALNWRLALQYVILLILLLGCWYLVLRRRAEVADAKKVEESRAEIRLRLLAEALKKTRIVRGYGMEAFEHDRFQHHLERYHAGRLHALRVQPFRSWLIGLLALVCIAFVVFFVGVNVLQLPDTPGGLSFSQVLLLLAIVALIPPSLTGLRQLPEHRARAAQAADRIFRYLSQTPRVSQAVEPKFLDPIARQIRFETVTYALPDKRKLLDGLDVTLTAGEVIAIVSLEPIEARALTCLLPRFIEPQAGRILFDGEDIAWVTLESLRAETVYVGGSDPFFTGTVSENILCGHSGYSLPDVTEAAKAAHAHNFILKLPQGYETVIGEHGEQLDAAQGFRLGIARAVLRKPALMIVEEPTVSLDEDTKSLLDDSYNRITRGRTVIFLPFRLSTLRRADTVIFLHRGKLEAQGPYQDLVKNSSLFRHWEYTHFNQFRRDLEPAEAR